MYRLYRKMTIFVWIKHICLANTIFVLDLRNSVIAGLPDKPYIQELC